MDRLNSRNDINVKALEGLSEVSWLDSVFVLRPTLMFPLVTMTLAGHKLAGASHPLTWDRWLFLSLALTALFGLVYLINQLRDKDTDDLNGKLYFISNDILSRSHVLIETVLLGIIIVTSLILAGMSHLLIWVLLMFVVAGLLYNFTPVALQQSPVGGIIAGALGGWMLVHMGGFISNQALSLTKEAPYVLAFTAACMLTTLPDVKGDTRVGKRTMAVVYGQRATVTVALTAITTSLIWGIVNNDWIIAVPAGLSIPFLVAGLIRNNQNLSITANKAAILTLSLAVGFCYPVYLLVIGAYFPLARWYYWKRFRIRYPSLGVG